MMAFAQTISEDHLQDCIEQKELILTGLIWTDGKVKSNTNLNIYV